MQQRARGKRRTGYLYSDSTPRIPKPKLDPGHVTPSKDPGTVKAQLLGKLGPRGYQRLIGELREISEKAA